MTHHRVSTQQCFFFGGAREGRLWRLGKGFAHWLSFHSLIVVWVGVAFIPQVSGQVSPEDHASHHQDRSQEGQTPAPPPAAGLEGEQSGATGGMMGGGMERMMEHMGAPPPKERKAWSPATRRTTSFWLARPSPQAT